MNLILGTNNDENISFDGYIDNSIIFIYPKILMG